MKEARDRQMWREEVVRLMGRVEELTGVTVTAENRARAIRMINDRRRGSCSA